MAKRKKKKQKKNTPQNKNKNNNHKLYGHEKIHVLEQQFEEGMTVGMFVKGGGKMSKLKQAIRAGTIEMVNENGEEDLPDDPEDDPEDDDLPEDPEEEEED